MMVNNSRIKASLYQCTFIGGDYRLVRAPHCDRSHLENFGQLSNHLGADHIIFVPSINHHVEGRIMQQYFAFLDVSYDKVHHSFLCYW